MRPGVASSTPRAASLVDTDALVERPARRAASRARRSTCSRRSRCRRLAAARGCANVVVTPHLAALHAGGAGPRRRRSSPSRSWPRSAGASVANALNIPLVRPRTSGACSGRSCRWPRSSGGSRWARAATRRAHRGRDRRRARRARHAPADLGRAARRVRAARGRERQPRQRALASPRTAASRWPSSAAPASSDYTNLLAVHACATGERPSSAPRIGRDDRAWLVRRAAPTTSRSSSTPPAPDCVNDDRPGHGRPRRHAARRAGRQHRQHDAVALGRGRRRDDGAVARRTSPTQRRARAGCAATPGSLRATALD